MKCTKLENEKTKKRFFFSFFFQHTIFRDYALICSQSRVHRSNTNQSGSHSILIACCQLPLRCSKGKRKWPNYFPKVPTRSEYFVYNVQQHATRFQILTDWHRFFGFGRFLIFWGNFFFLRFAFFFFVFEQRTLRTQTFDSNSFWI